MIEVACWPASGGERRRYAGVSHIDVAKLDAGKVQDTLDRHGLEISSLAYYPNNLHPDPAERRAANAHLRKVIDAAARLGVPTVGTFVGRDKTKNVPDNFREFRKVWPRLVSYAEDRGVNVAIENCPMIFSWDEWPGGTNLASTPAAWDEMFSLVPSKRFGLNLDPSHLVWLQIDYERVVRDYASRILHVHAKDMEIDRDGLYRHGTASQGMGWQVPRLPGLGEVRWDRFLSQLYRVGYDGVVSVEHEDRAFERTEALVKRGFLIARDTLRRPTFALSDRASRLRCSPEASLAPHSREGHVRGDKQSASRGGADGSRKGDRDHRIVTDELRRGGEGRDRQGRGDRPRHQGRVGRRGARRRREQRGHRVPRHDAGLVRPGLNLVRERDSAGAESRCRWLSRQAGIR